MSIFGKIRDAIFGSKTAAPTGTDATTGITPSTTDFPGMGTSAGTTATAVDVDAVLTQKLAAKGNPALNWRSSIVDLMKLLDLDSSLDNRKELATELGYTGAKDGSAEMNTWLHRAVMQELAKNGGQVPAGLAD